MGAGDLTEAGSPPVSVGVVFERFPASIRGAVVVRGTDPDPHQVELVEAWVAEAHAWSRPAYPVATDPVVVDMAPRAEVLIPFDLSVAGMDPGWYVAAAEVEVDGQQRIRGPQDGKRFLVPWPKDQVRRGVVAEDVAIGIPGAEPAVIERIEGKADRTVIRWRAEEVGDLRVSAGSRRLPVLESSHDPATGTGTTVLYPLLTSYRRLTVEVPGRPGTARRAARPTTIDLP